MCLLYEYMHHYHSFACDDDANSTSYPVTATDPNFPKLFTQASDMRHTDMEWPKFFNQRRHTNKPASHI